MLYEALKISENDICRCKIEHKTKNKRSSSCILPIIIRSTFKTSNIMSYSWNKQIGGLRTYFFKNPLEFFINLLYLRKFQTNWSSNPGNCTKLCHISLGNSKTKNQDPWKFHIIIFSWSPSGNFTCYFFDTPWKFHILNPILIFSEIAQSKEGVYFLSFNFGWYFIHLDFV